MRELLDMQFNKAILKCGESPEKLPQNLAEYHSDNIGGKTTSPPKTDLTQSSLITKGLIDSLADE